MDRSTNEESEEQKDVHKEIFSGQIIKSGTMNSEYAYFKFNAAGMKKLITIKVSPENKNSDPDLYVSCSYKWPQSSKYDWKVMELGTVILQIHPNDPLYSDSWYYIGILGSKFGYNHFSLELSLSDPIPISTLSKGISEKFTIPPQGVCFFKYDIFPKPDEAIFAIKGIPGPDKLEIDASYKWLYPSRECCVWSSHEQSELVDELCPDLLPFILDENNNVIYSCDPKNITTPKKQSTDSVGILFQTEGWKEEKHSIFIGAYNLTSAELPVTLLANDYQEFEALSEEIAERAKIFQSATVGSDSSSVSHSERLSRGLEGQEFTYGEIEFVHFIPLLHLASPPKNGIFWDLGCGGGKVLIAAALSGLSFSQICGVEFLEGLYKCAQEAVKQVSHYNKFQVIQGNIIEVDWSNADLINEKEGNYEVNVCFLGLAILTVIIMMRIVSLYF